MYVLRSNEIKNNNNKKLDNFNKKISLNRRYLIKEEQHAAATVENGKNSKNFSSSTVKII